jgi:aminoglycoside phosphotransferase (APT) family kinase protein
LPKSFPRAELAAATGAEPVRWKSVRGAGYGTNTAKWSVELADGGRAFIKLALDDLAAGWLRDEWRVYESVDASFMATPIAWHDSDGTTFVVIEDLSDAHWPPPWSPAHIALVLEMLAEVHATAAPQELPSLGSLRDVLDGWRSVAADPEAFLSTGICSSEWIDEALPALAEASAHCELAGEALVHLDVRSDNLCIREDRVVLVDWNLAAVGNGLIDAVAWAPSLRLEEGPEPWELVPDSGGLASLLAGFFASRAGLPAPETAPTVREFQRRQLEVALPWAARELGLDAPT